MADGDSNTLPTHLHAVAAHHEALAADHQAAADHHEALAEHMHNAADAADSQLQAAETEQEANGPHRAMPPGGSAQNRAFRFGGQAARTLSAATRGRR